MSSSLRRVVAKYPAGLAFLGSSFLGPSDPCWLLLHIRDWTRKKSTLSCSGPFCGLWYHSTHVYIIFLPSKCQGTLYKGRLIRVAWDERRKGLGAAKQRNQGPIQTKTNNTTGWGGGEGGGGPEEYDAGGMGCWWVGEDEGRKDEGSEASSSNLQLHFTGPPPLASTLARYEATRVHGHCPQGNSRVCQ